MQNLVAAYEEAFKPYLEALHRTTNAVWAASEFTRQTAEAANNTADAVFETVDRARGALPDKIDLTGYRMC